MTERYLTLDSSLFEHLRITLDASADLAAEREHLAKRMKELFVDRFIAPEIEGRKYLGFRSQRVDFDGVPIRLTEAYDMYAFEQLRILDAIGYPEEAICSPGPPPLPS
jgi:hypothetical protein